MKYMINKEHVYLMDDNGGLLGSVDFHETAPHVYDITHTVVLPEMRGQGIAGKLVAKAVEEIRRRGGKVTASCEYAKSWLKKHPIKQDYDIASDETVKKISRKLMKKNKEAYEVLAK